MRGDREIAGVHYDPDKIFAPVVSWTTVRLLLLLAAQLDLATRQVDYVAAFVHSPIPMPKDYHKMTREEQRPVDIEIINEFISINNYTNVDTTSLPVHFLRE